MLSLLCASKVPPVLALRFHLSAPFVMQRAPMSVRQPQSQRIDGSAMPTVGRVSKPIAGTVSDCSVCTLWRRQMEIRASGSFEDDCLGGGFPLCSADSDELDVRVPSAVAELNDAQVLNARWVLDSAYGGHLWTRATRSARSIVLPGRVAGWKPQTMRSAASRLDIGTAGVLHATCNVAMVPQRAARHSIECAA